MALLSAIKIYISSWYVAENLKKEKNKKTNVTPFSSVYFSLLKIAIFRRMLKRFYIENRVIQKPEI